ncbi:hypothetical protein F1880_002065 [Penicillium rolfsii]|nr:hypothetical protein F1880_002065 [Penicillium rolfsii]
MHFSLIALSAAITLPLASAYPVNADDLHCRSGPGTNYGIVKSYKRDTDLSITCQAAGISVNGDQLWDKTSDGCYVSDYYVKTGSSSYITKHCDGGSTEDRSSGDDLPGLSATQSKHARAIIAEAKSEDLGLHGCAAGIATALVESNILVYANQDVPSSLNYPHDAVGSDQDSVGIFQQRAMYYPDIAADMDATKSAAQFFKNMKNISGWKSMAVGALCQEVQGSAYPSRYAERVAEAESICNAGGI